MENELYHYGRKGMKWYQRIFTKGKEARAKKKNEQMEKDRENAEEYKKAIRNSRSAKQVYDNAHLFTDKELNEIYQRLNTENNIKNLIPEKVNKGKKFVEGISTTFKTVGEGTKNLNNVITQFQNFGKLLGGKKANTAANSKSAPTADSKEKTKSEKKTESKSDSKVERVTNFEILDRVAKTASSRQSNKVRDILDYNDYEGGRPSYDATKLAKSMVNNIGSRTVSSIMNNQNAISSVDDYLLSIGVRRVDN